MEIWKPSVRCGFTAPDVAEDVEFAARVPMALMLVRESRIGLSGGA
ncbi:hypothetical protein [Nocardia abscessus]|nr:hypothetical protein [Nocardia abscessus]